ncbi:MAG: dihydrolipoyl dehydrogenase [Candidatus Kapabacteria bacterium]|nr:dihydrolipoyl dehydrogenase [Candidatus Kapabacteria bacterium]MCS7170034.1 dihydrolipoyl dehydrogenase [Candidatus Kapabacteria bacterium]MDW7996315.1 dihydrolipoyl dehydrogenase [Bacteroidota bacterium]MDW8226050.1 dihydrolipoyl dehydrogenase [Bacteroidota bacterium]
MNQHQCDLVVIGAGPGGYVAAIRAAQLKLRTICVERDRLGGICLNWGCIPTKALLRSAEQMHFLKRAAEFGFSVDSPRFNFPRIIERSRQIADRMSNGIAYLFRKYGVQNLHGTATIADVGHVEVRDESGTVTDRIECRHIIVATGARPRTLPGIEVDRERILTSTEAMLLQEPPESLIIIGAGAIGVEFAYFFNAFGTKVTLVELMSRILPSEDEEVSRELERHFKKEGIQILSSTKVVAAKRKGKGVNVTVEASDGSQRTLTAAMALNAVGVQGNVEDLGLDRLGVQIERSYIKVDPYLRTNVPGIYAIGDVAGPPWLAHKASAEGIVCVEAIAGHDPLPVDYTNIPACTYCQPQIASIGMTEQQAREAGHELKVGKFPFSASGKAWGIGEPRGFVKLIFDARYGELLGAHMIGPDVTELIAEVGVARTLEATAQTIFRTVHAHPTLSEAVMEAAAVAYDEAINF